MNNSFIKKATPHLIAIGVILIVIAVYFMPMLGGKVLKQYDVLQWKATYQEIADFEQRTGERTFWTNSIFGGMPTYLIGASYKGNFTANISFYLSNVLKNPADTIFLLYICFYILLISFDVAPMLAIVGSLAFALSSFNFINLDAGHITKGNAIAFIPLVMAGINICLRKNRLLGAALTGIAVSFELAAGHVQITYYLIFIILAWVITEFIIAIKTGKLPQLLICGLYLAISAVIGIGTNITGLLATEEYGKYSIRAKSELTKTVGGESNSANSSDGLDKDYALSWSNGIVEPFTLMIANFYGGASSGELSTSSESYKVLKENGIPNPKDAVKQMPVYWGDQPFTAGPIYYGSIIVFLFVFGMFLLKGPEKWWIFAVAMVAIFLSMGKNFMSFTDLFFNYFPLYNKFRSVTFILCIAQVMFPLLAILAIRDASNGSRKKEEIMKALKYSMYLVGGICLVFAIIPGIFFNFSSLSDERIRQNFPALVDALVKDRESMLRIDAMRSLLFIAAAFGLVWYSLSGKLKKEYFLIALGLMVTIDLWQVDKRYLNDGDFEKKKAEAAVAKTPYDEVILQDKDPHYRVFNTTTDFDKDAITAYYHKSIGGYHGAKMRRYQELIEWQLGRNNMECVNMLNVKYFIVADSTNQKYVQQNPFTNGNAWFVKEYKIVNNADEEIVALNEDRTNPSVGFKSKQTAIIDKRFESEVKGLTLQPDTAASIVLTSYAPNKLTYQSNTSIAQLAVFSEIYYDKGWDAYIDGQLAPHFRADYVLRAMAVPAGKHTIEFKFEPKTIVMGEKIALASSAILYGSLIIILALSFFKSKKEESANQ
jgi:hypothetical protein